MTEADPAARRRRRRGWIALAALLLAGLMPALLVGVPLWRQQLARRPGLNRGHQPPPPPRCRRQGARRFEVIVVGDEPAGVMTALELQRQLRDLAGVRHPRIALLHSEALDAPIGGTISRSGLAYLDRNQVPPDLRTGRPLFVPSSALYRRFLKLTGVRVIAVDPRRAARALARALKAAAITVLPDAQLTGATLEGSRLCTLESVRYGSLGAAYVVDASLGAELAHRVGVPFLSGLGPPALTRDSIALGWVFEVYGLPLEAVREAEASLTDRILDPRDDEAQRWLALWPEYRGRDSRHQLLADLLDPLGRPLLAYGSTVDSADQQSPVFSIAFHGQNGIPPRSPVWSVRLDPANIAILPGRLSFNALIFHNDAAQNRLVLAGHGRPLAWMRTPAIEVTRFFRRLGASRVVWMPELYIRSADEIAHPVQALSATRMAQGGVPAAEALGTFTYPLDFRGGLSRFVPPARPTFNFGYRHTLPRELANLAVLGPAAGYGGLGEGAGRIIELNISVGQGLAAAIALAWQRQIPLAAVDPQAVASLRPPGYDPYGRPSQRTLLRVLLDRFEALLLQLLHRPSGPP
ncbi:MAG: FAD-dependent oxidoreductase [Cyanobium sp.]